MIKIIHQRDIVLERDTMWLIKGLIPKHGVTVIWGKPGCGKTFWTVDIAAHVANNLSYRGLDVEHGSVVYFAFEAGGTFPRRILGAAMGIEGASGDAPLWISTGYFTISKEPRLEQDSNGVVRKRYIQEDMIEQLCIMHNDTPLRLVVLDTLNMSLDGSENSDEDMRHYVVVAKAISDAFNCAVIIVHHCGVAGDRPRGHTSLTGAAVCQIRIEKDEHRTRPCIKAKTEKMKDGSDDMVLYSWLTPVSIGLDDKGDEMESCVLRSAPPPATSGGDPYTMSPRDKKALAILETLGGRITLEEWKRQCVTQGLGSSSDKIDSRRKAYDRARDSLVRQRIVAISGINVYIAAAKEEDETS